ncbi:hypothetical protein EYF80_047966 [Liparis tanakae]|uniref:Uncharacterized protein n=1 Tax=Liparis tanakae TaxID=230148 RepID=A0A4Z2FL32_9TELE|nr:hypothetical protein EYF80_047966 [Liparis tanakae]
MGKMRRRPRDGPDRRRSTGSRSLPPLSSLTDRMLLPLQTPWHTWALRRRDRGPAVRRGGAPLCLRYCIQPHSSSCAIIPYSRKMSTAGSIQMRYPNIGRLARDK